jgi:hypothetical protein
MVRATGWHSGDPDSIPGRDGLYTFGYTCISQHFESASAEILRYIKPLIYIYFIFILIACVLQYLSTLEKQIADFTSENQQLRNENLHLKNQLQQLQQEVRGNNSSHHL